jgi:hypothetical protein
MLLLSYESQQYGICTWLGCVILMLWHIMLILAS